jgi:uncharacterized protein DUF1877
VISKPSVLGHESTAFTAADIYPKIWDEGASLFDEFLAPAFQRLKGFYAAAAAGGDAVLIVIT